MTAADATPCATLPFEGSTLCGYCGRPLILWAADDWRCQVCGPELARIVSIEEWGQWMRRQGARS